MSKENVLDLFHASNEEALDVTLGKILPEVVKQISEMVVSEATASIICEILGAVFPRINNIRLGWKQNRLERNIKKAIEVLQKNDSLIESQLEVLEKNNQDQMFRTKYCEMMLDTIYDEIQESKVKYGINGFINLMCIENPNEDMTLMFFKTLTELSDLDIRVLKCFSYEHEENYYSVMQDVDISDMQYRFVKEKLERFGLLQNKNADIRDMDLAIIIDYLKDIDKQSKSKNPKSVKFPSKVKKLGNNNLYEITSLGREFLKLMEPISK